MTNAPVKPGLSVDPVHIAASTGKVSFLVKIACTDPNWPCRWPAGHTCRQPMRLLLRIPANKRVHVAVMFSLTYTGAQAEQDCRQWVSPRFQQRTGLQSAD